MGSSLLLSRSRVPLHRYVRCVSEWGQRKNIAAFFFSYSLSDLSFCLTCGSAILLWPGPTTMIAMPNNTFSIIIFTYAIATSNRKKKRKLMKRVSCGYSILPSGLHIQSTPPASLFRPLLFWGRQHRRRCRACVLCSLKAKKFASFFCWCFLHHVSTDRVE